MRFHSSFHDWRRDSATFGQRIWTNDHQLDFRVADGFHIYAMHWSESFVKMFVDGQIVNCVTKQEMGDDWVAFNEQKIWIDSETFDWEVGPSQLKASDFGVGQEFIVDYCRVWQSKRAGVDCERRANLVTNPGFETDERAWRGVAVVSDDAYSGRRAASLETGSVIEQTVTVKPNT